MLTMTKDATPYADYATTAWPGLYRLAYLLSGNHADAEDLAQQTLVKVYRNWARVEASGSPHGYVRRMLTNTFLSSRRPLRLRQEILTDAPPERVSAAPDADARMVVWPHVRSLPPRQRAVIVLRYYEDLSEAQIAEVLGCTAGTVKSTAHRALASLRAAIAAADIDGTEA